MACASISAAAPEMAQGRSADLGATFRIVTTTGSNASEAPHAHRIDPPPQAAWADCTSDDDDDNHHKRIARAGAKAVQDEFLFNAGATAAVSNVKSTTSRTIHDLVSALSHSDSVSAALFKRVMELEEQLARLAAAASAAPLPPTHHRVRGALRATPPHVVAGSSGNAPGAAVAVAMPAVLHRSLESLFSLPAVETIQVLYSHYVNTTATGVRGGGGETPAQRSQPFGLSREEQQPVAATPFTRDNNVGAPVAGSPLWPAPHGATTWQEAEPYASPSPLRGRRPGPVPADRIRLTYFNVQASCAASAETSRLCAITSTGRALRFAFAIPVFLDRFVVTTPGRGCGPLTYTAFVAVDGLADLVFAGDGPLRDEATDHVVVLAKPVRQRCIVVLVVEFNARAACEFSVVDVAVAGHYRDRVAVQIL